MKARLCKHDPSFCSHAVALPDGVKESWSLGVRDTWLLNISISLPCCCIAGLQRQLPDTEPKRFTAIPIWQNFSPGTVGGTVGTGPACAPDASLMCTA
jgi:hypothetical protein